MTDEEFAEFQEWLAFKRMRAAAQPAPPPPASVMAPSRSPTIEELFSEYKPTAERRRSFKSTQYCHWKHLLPFWGPLTIDQCTWRKADEYQMLRLQQPIQVPAAGGGTQDGKRLTSPWTVNLEMNSLRACINHHRKRGRVDRNPLAGHPDLEVEPLRRFAIQYADFCRILTHMPTVSRLMMILAYETGLRRDEFRLLVDSEVDLVSEVKTITLPPARCKGRKRGRTVVLSDEAIEVIRVARSIRMVGSQYVFPNPLRIDGSEMPKSTLGQHFRRARELANVKGPGNQEIWIHTLRKSYGENKAKGGMPIYLLMNQLGHTDPRVHFEYTQIAKEHLGAVVPYLNQGPNRHGPQQATAPDAQPSNLIKFAKHNE